MATSPCDSLCWMMDERWGAIGNHCELPVHHYGSHRMTLNACDPPATLVWDGEASRVPPSAKLSR